MATNRKIVLVPDNMGRAGVDLLESARRSRRPRLPRHHHPARPSPLLTDAAAIALSGTPYRQTEMDASPAMQVVARIGVGYDAVEVPALTARNVPLMIAGTSNSTSVAEHALYLIFTLAKRGPGLDRSVRNARWADRYTDMPAELAGKTVLVVGFGRIGTRTARRCAAFDMTVLVHDPYVPAETIRAAGCEPAADLDAALPRTDIVTIHCPKTPETVGLFDARRLALLKRGAFIVNTARGGIIDEPALHAALTRGHLRGAGLDVFADEPTPLPTTRCSRSTA